MISLNRFFFILSYHHPYSSPTLSFPHVIVSRVSFSLVFTTPSSINNLFFAFNCTYYSLNVQYNDFFFAIYYYLISRFGIRSCITTSLFRIRLCSLSLSPTTVLKSNASIKLVIGVHEGDRSCQCAALRNPCSHLYSVDTA